MQRCDFASIMDIVCGDLIDGSFPNRLDFMGTLFSLFFSESEEEIYYDPSQVNKWFIGVLKPSPAICKFYATSEKHQQELAITLEDVILPCLSDQAMVVQRVYELLVQDTTVSENKKQELCDRREDGDSVFLAAVLSFGLGRPFVARDIRKPEKNQIGSKSPSVQDYIFDADAPKPCRGFCGRDAELENVHAALEQNGKIFLQGIPGIGKSEIAKAYAKNYKKEYTNILYFLYSGSLKRDIAELQFADDRDGEDEDKRFQRHNRFLRTLKEDTLLIIDNFNTTAAQEDLLPVVMKYRCKILFTTKSNFAEQPCVTVEEISDHTVLYELFASHYRDADSHRTTVEAIMETVHYHNRQQEATDGMAG